MSNSTDLFDDLDLYTGLDTSLDTDLDNYLSSIPQDDSAASTDSGSEIDVDELLTYASTSLDDDTDEIQLDYLRPQKRVRFSDGKDVLTFDQDTPAADVVHTGDFAEGVPRTVAPLIRFEIGDKDIALRQPLQIPPPIVFNESTASVALPPIATVSGDIGGGSGYGALADIPYAVSRTELKDKDSGEILLFDGNHGKALKRKYKSKAGRFRLQKPQSEMTKAELTQYKRECKMRRIRARDARRDTIHKIRPAGADSLPDSQAGDRRNAYLSEHQDDGVGKTLAIMGWAKQCGQSDPVQAKLYNEYLLSFLAAPHGYLQGQPVGLAPFMAPPQMIEHAHLFP